MTREQPVDPRASARWIIKLVLGVGGVLVLAALGLTAREWAFLHVSEEATAVISELATASMRSNTHWATDYRAGTGYRVIATFRAPDGHSVTVRSPIVSRFTWLKAGDRVQVNYPPGRPDEAVLALFADRWLLPLILGGIGGGAIAIAAAAMWLLRQPGTRVTTVRSNELRASTTSVLQLGGAAQASDSPSASSSSAAPENTRPVTVTATWPITTPPRIGRWIAASILGLAVILAVFVKSRPEPDAKAIGSNGAGIRAPGYPETLKVDPPTTLRGSDTQAQPSSDRSIQTTDAEKLTAMAAEFLARPQQTAAAQAVLRDQAKALSLSCPQLRFGPGALLVQAAPFPQFDPSGTLRRGLVRQRFTGLGCPGRSPLFNVWTYADGSGTPARTVTGYLGSTRADPSLMRDATPIVLGVAAKLVTGCREMAVMDTRLPEPTPAGAARAWAEEWLVTGCGRRVALTVRFVPDAQRGMTRIEVPQELARSLDPA